MRNGGSHGGSDKEELYVPLVLFSEKCTKGKNKYGQHIEISKNKKITYLYVL